MQTEDLVLNEGGQGQKVEEVGEVFPNICVAVLAEAFVVETVDLCDLSGFVVAAEDCNTSRVADFERNEKGDGLDAVVASVDIVA